MGKKKASTKKTPTRPAKKKAPKKGSPNKYRAEEKVNKPDAKKAAKKISSEKSASTIQGKDILTLLDVPNRKKLPEKPQELDCKLYNIVHKQSNEYKEFLAFIRDGISPSAACASSGICTYSEVMVYLKRGIQDVNRNPTEIVDTYYSRFYIDFIRTAGLPVGEAELHIKETDPKFWLRNSPLSRMLGDHWRDDPDKKVTHSHSGSIEHFLGADSKQEVNPDELLIEGEVVNDALQDLQKSGLITLNPDYDIAKRIQRGELLSEDELELLEDQESTGSDGTLQLDNQGMPLLLPSPESGD